ncbi:hypothetical protein LSH36_39g10000 [Paralvinella palmiformis]|uniref:Uncharacterized protein n=1 Tax=Paralvinella palmiformis TaxID=53620 RepID=A0AAD9NDX8_9ANNE|nr:hypothetical protein LSH36_39g10000 [Paralvinella palmiformis]
MLLVDNYIETCSTFVPDDGLSIPRYTQVRVQVPEEVVDEVNVTLIGTHLGCGHNLYVSPLSTFDLRKWTGRWTTCYLMDVAVDHDKDTCFYRCHCKIHPEREKRVIGLFVTYSSSTTPQVDVIIDNLHNDAGFF